MALLWKCLAGAFILIDNDVPTKKAMIEVKRSDNFMVNMIFLSNF